MRAFPNLFALSAAAATAFFFAAYVLIAADLALAGENDQVPAAENAGQNGGNSGGMCSCPASSGASSGPSSGQSNDPATQPPQDAIKPSWRRNKFAGQAMNPSVPAGLDRSDRVAALEVVQVALSQVGDGSSYVWHRGHGKLSGIIQPTASFKRDNGQVCRHLVIMFASGEHSRKMETIACRLDSGIWQIDG